MIYKTGDRVRIVSQKSGNGWNSEGLMDKYLGRVMTVCYVSFNYYCLEEDNECWCWYEDMIAGPASINKPERFKIISSK